MKMWRLILFLGVALFLRPLMAVTPVTDPFLYGINYYPKNAIWDLMWTNYEPSSTEADLRQISKLGFNSIRIFLQYEAFHSPRARNHSENSLQHLLDTAKKNDLRVLITLFDWTRPYDPNWNQDTQNHLKRLVFRFNAHSAVMGWDLKNEPDLDYRFYASPDYVNLWIQKTLPDLKSLVGEKLVTVGWLNPPPNSSVDRISDFLSFHHYEEPEKIPRRIEELKMRNPKIAWVLEEFGFSTVRGTADESEQSRRLSGAIRAVIENRGAGIFLWALHDFDSKQGRDRPPAENTFGLFGVEGRAKMAVRRLLPPCLLFYSPARRLFDRIPLAPKELTACFRSMGTTAVLRVTDRNGREILKKTAPLAAEPMHCETFSVRELWGGLVGRGFTAEIAAPNLTTLGGRPTGECRIALDDYFP